MSSQVLAPRPANQPVTTKAQGSLSSLPEEVQSLNLPAQQAAAAAPATGTAPSAEPSTARKTEQKTTP